MPDLAVPVLAVRLARWDMMAVVPMYDPPRHDTKQTIEDCIEKGIAVKMVTGEGFPYPAAAAAILHAVRVNLQALCTLALRTASPFEAVIIALLGILHASCAMHEPYTPADEHCIKGLASELPASRDIHGRATTMHGGMHNAKLPARGLRRIY